MNLIDIDNSYAYIKLPNGFSICDECQIIFAPNGTGKTTLFNILIKQNKDKCEVYTYDDTIEPTYKLIDGKKKKLEINPLSINYAKEESIKDNEKQQLLVKDAIGIVFPGKSVTKLKKELKADSKILNTINDDNVCSFYAPLDSVKYVV